MKEVKVTIFDVRWDRKQTPPPERAIELYSHQPLKKRWRGDMRLDKIKKIQTVDSKSAYLLDFAKERTTGPGRLTNDTPVEAIDLDADANFGEETAALYVPHRKWLIVLNNFFGVGPNRIMGYLNQANPADEPFDYEAAFKIDTKAMNSAKKMKHFKSITIGATVDALEAADRDAGTGLARGLSKSGAFRVQLSISANEPYGRGKELNEGFVRKLGNALLGDDGTSKFIVKGHDPDLDKDVAVDLVDQKMSKKYDADKMLELEARRYTQDSRFKLLQLAYEEWNQAL